MVLGGFRSFHVLVTTQTNTEIYMQEWHCIFPLCTTLILYGHVFSMTWYKIVMQGFLVIYYGISQLSLGVSLHTHEPLGEYIQRK